MAPAWLTRPRRMVTALDTRPQALAPAVTGSIPTYAEYVGYRGMWAMQVPAYARGVNLISGSVAQLPLTQFSDPDPLTLGFLAQPEATRGAWVTKQRTVADLIGLGLAYWRIAAVVSGRVTLVEQLPADTITAAPSGVLTTSTGDTLHPSNPRTPPVVGQVIVFTAYRDGALLTGVDVLTTALALEAAVLRYAETPHPGDVLENVSNYEMSDAEVDAMLARWTKARQESAVAYANQGIKLGDAKGWSPSELALVEQRNQSALQIARLLNLDPMWLGASVEGSSLTYQNRVDARVDLYGLTLIDYVLAVEQRLSMPDVAAAPVTADASAFLRANLDARVSMATALLTAQVITVDEARAWISDRPTGGPA